MPKIEVYASVFCAYCDRAKALLKQKGVSFTEISLEAEPNRRDEMIKRAGGRRTVPQIFIDDVHIGGCDDLIALDRDGRLDPLLRAPA
ncbi:MAG: glutaredoxin 3 [Alphaproteobacteria bacterium]